jgi:hypothetical protein
MELCPSETRAKLSCKNESLQLSITVHTTNHFDGDPLQVCQVANHDYFEEIKQMPKKALEQVKMAV